VGKKYGSKGHPHTGNAAHMGSISCTIEHPVILTSLKITERREAYVEDK
jgi:hypothetical protein